MQKAQRWIGISDAPHLDPVGFDFSVSNASMTLPEASNRAVNA